MLRRDWSTQHCNLVYTIDILNNSHCNKHPLKLWKKSFIPPLWPTVYVQCTCLCKLIMHLNKLTLICTDRNNTTYPLQHVYKTQSVTQHMYAHNHMVPAITVIPHKGMSSQKHSHMYFDRHTDRQLIYTWTICYYLYISYSLITAI